MRRRLPCLLLAVLPACHGFFGGRTTDEDQALNNFAEARQRAATYYDGGDYFRAAAQYAKALEFRPKHVPTRLGYAYSLMYTDVPSNLLKAKKEFDDLGRQREQQEEVKRVYGLGLTYRNLAVHHWRRSRKREDEGRPDLAKQDLSIARDYARDGIERMEKVLEIDALLAGEQIAAPRRVSASLAPDAHVAIAHCEIVLGDREHPERLESAVEHINEFARIAATARRFWEQRRERLLVTDPMREAELGTAGPTTLDNEQRQRYEERIGRTILQEVAVRRILVDTYHYLLRFEEAIEECNTILALDPSEDEVLYLRARAYENLKPPNYYAALEDMKEYRRRQDLGKLTEKLVAINKLIQRYEEKVKEGAAQRPPP